MLTKVDIESYFLAEKAESFVFLGVGLAAILLGLAFWFWWRTPFLRGAAVPLVLVGALLSTVGSTILFRSDADIARVTSALERAPVDLKNKELPRMKKVMQDFRLYRKIEIVLAAAGLVLWIVFRGRSSGDFWSGLGIALTAMAVIALTADYFAERRGHQYLEKLEAQVRPQR